MPVAPLEPFTKMLLAQLLLMAIIALIGWAVDHGLAYRAQRLYLRRYRLDAADNLLARKHNTQVRVLLRSADVSGAASSRSARC